MERSELIAELMTRIGSIKRLMHAQRYQCNEAGESISGPQVAILFAIKRSTVISQNELAKHLFMTPGGVSQLVEQLIELELVTRTQSAHDRRSYELTLSQAGMDFTSKVAKRHHDIIRNTTSGITEKELTQFNAVLEKIANAIQATNDTDKE